MDKVNKKIGRGVSYRVNKIEIDPNKKEIDKALIEDRASFKSVATRFNYEPYEISSYYKNKVLPQMAKVLKEDRKEDVSKVIRQLEDIMTKLQKLLFACDRWLTDPENPDEYNLEPRASELVIVYNELEFSNGKTKKVRKKDTLQSLLLQTSDLYNEVLQVNTKNADPRELILKTSGEIREQLKLIAEISGELKNVSNSVNINVLAPNIVNSIIRATTENPEIQGNIIHELMGMIHANTDKNRLQ